MPSDISRIDLACDRFEQAWKAGHRPRIEDYLAESPESDRPSLLSELLRVEIELRREAGQTPVADEYLQRFRDHADVVRASFPRPPTDEGTVQTHTLDDEAEVGTQLRYFGDFLLLEKIGEGGMGVVYRALQRSLNRDVAVKRIRNGHFATKEEVCRFQHEAEAIANLDHPNIVPIYQTGQQEGLHFFSMKLIEGESLAKRLSTYVADPAAAARIIAAAARALHHAHQREILHRDVKPGNILIDSEGQPHVTDFGLAARFEEVTDWSVSGRVMGTPSYMAPEQEAGHRRSISALTDVHGLGATLYAALTGRPPFEGETMAETLAQVRDKEPKSPRALNPRVDRDLETICLKCLQKSPAQRYGSALEVAEDLERWLRGEPIEARPVRPWVRMAKWVKRKPANAALGAAGILVAALGLLVATFAMAFFKDPDALQPPYNRTLTPKNEALQKKHGDDMKRLQLAGKYPEALRSEEELVKIYQEDYTNDHPHTKTVMARRDSLKRVAALPADAQEEFCRVVTQFNLKVLDTLDERKDLDQIIALKRRGLEVARKYLGDDDFEVAAGKLFLGSLLQKKADPNPDQEAFDLTNEALYFFMHHMGDKCELTLVAYNNRGIELERQGKILDAKPIQENVLRVRKETLGRLHRYTIASSFILARVSRKLSDDPNMDPGVKSENLKDAKKYYAEACKGLHDLSDPKYESNPQHGYIREIAYYESVARVYHSSSEFQCEAGDWKGWRMSYDEAVTLLTKDLDFTKGFWDKDSSFDEKRRSLLAGRARAEARFHAQQATLAHRYGHEADPKMLSETELLNRAMKALKSADKYEYLDVKFLNEDQDLSPLRDLDDFKKFVDKVSARGKAKDAEPGKPAADPGP